MSGEIEVTQLVETIEVKAGDTVEVTQQLSTIEVVDGDKIEVTETQEIVELKAGDVIEVAEEILQVVIDTSGGGGGGGPHKPSHVTGGTDALVKGDVLAAAARYLETLGSDPGADVARWWLNGALLKYYDNAGDEILQTVQKRGDVIVDWEHGARGSGLHDDSHGASHALSDGDLHTGPLSAAQHPPPSHHPKAHTAIVGPDASEADYTTIEAAIDAGAKAIFIRNGTYAGFTWDNPDVKSITGESQEGVQITGDCSFTVDDTECQNLWFRPTVADQIITLDTGGLRPTTFNGVAFGDVNTGFLTTVIPGGTVDPSQPAQPRYLNGRFKGGPLCAWNKVWTFDASAGTYVDNTSQGGGNYNPLDAGAVGDICYLTMGASTRRLPFAMVYQPTGPTCANGSGPAPIVAYEYWNGAGWAAAAVSFWPNTVGTEVRIFRSAGYVTITPPVAWALTAVGPVGQEVSGYWLRIRVTTAFTTAPVVKQILPMGYQAVSDFDQVSMTRRNWISPQMTDCVFEEYNGSIIVDHTNSQGLQAAGVAGIFQGLVFRGNSRSELLVTPLGSTVSLSAENVTGRGVRLGNNNLAQLTMNGPASGFAAIAGEGGRVDSATANTLTAATGADGLGNPSMGSDLTFCEVLIIYGTGAGQRRVIIDNDLSLSITVRDNWAVTPDTTSIFIIYDPLHTAILTGSGSTANVNLYGFNVGVRPASPTHNRMSVSGFMNSVALGVSSFSGSTVALRPFSVGPMLYTVGSEVHGGRAAIIDMSGGVFASTPEINASEGNVGNVVTSDISTGVVGRTSRTKMVDISGPSTGIVGFGRTSGDLIPFADNEMNYGSATFALAAIYTYLANIKGNLDHDGANVGFYGVAPVARPAAYTQTYATADKTHAAFTSADLAAFTGGAVGFLDAAERDNIRTQLNALRADVADVKQLANAIIDDLQSQGLLQ